MYQVCGWDREGRRLSWEARVEKVGFEVFPERCDRGTVSYLEGERLPKNWGIGMLLLHTNSTNIDLMEMVHVKKTKLNPYF